MVWHSHVDTSGPQKSFVLESNSASLMISNISARHDSPIQVFAETANSRSGFKYPSMTRKLKCTITLACIRVLQLELYPKIWGLSRILAVCKKSINLGVKDRRLPSKFRKCLLLHTKFPCSQLGGKCRS
jgi:hypothetical protein